jgi:hypothetical protein
LKDFVEKDSTRLCVVGDVLVKSSDQLIKQTSQVIELIKLAHKSHNDDNTLSEEELIEINEEINNKKDKV